MNAIAETYKFTVEEFVRLFEVGIFDDHDRFELLEGEIIIMHAIGCRHGQAVTNLNSEFMEQSRRRFALSPQNPIWLEQTSLPQPDVVLVPRDRRGKHHHPKPDEIFLVVEVSDSSLAYDRQRKMGAYARFGVREFWIVNLVEDTIETFGESNGEAYQRTRIWRRGETLSPEAFPDVNIDVDAIIPDRLPEQ